MASTIIAQIHDKYVGEMVELFKIDLLPIGINTQFYLTNSSYTPTIGIGGGESEEGGLEVISSGETGTISFGGQLYSPFPIMCTNLSRSIANAPGRITLKVSKVNTLLAGVVQQYGDIVGAEFKRIRTFSNFLDGKVNADSSQHFPIEVYTIIQKSIWSPESIEFICATKLDRPGLNIPRRQILRDNVRGSLYCPGVARTGVRTS